MHQARAETGEPSSESIGVDEFAEATQKDRALSVMAGLNRSWIRWQSQLVADCDATHWARERLCRWLLLASDRMGSTTIVATQDSIADGLGLLRTTVTLLTLDLEVAGAIQTRRGKITVCDRALLESSACICCAKLDSSKWPSHRLAAPIRIATHEDDGLNTGRPESPHHHDL